MAAAQLACTTMALSAPAALAAQADNQRLGVTPTEITVGSCAPLSGQMKERGGQVVSGGRAYFSYINDQGGVNGRKIKLASCDDLYTGDGAISCFNTCLKDKVFLGTLFQGTTPATKYVPAFETHGLPAVGFSTGGEFIVQPVHRYVFQLRASYADEATEQVNTLVKQLNRKRIAVVYQIDAYGAACREGVVNALQNVKSAPVTEVSFPRLSRDIDPIIAQLKAAKPDAVILGAAGDALPLIIKRKKELGDNVVMVAFDVGTDLLMKEAGGSANGTLITQIIPFTRSELPTVKLYKQCMEKYEHSAPNWSSFEGFLIGMATAEGLKRAGKDPTRDGFVKGMESIHNFDMGLGPSFKLNYSPTQHDGLRGGVYWTVIKDGQVENVPKISLYKKK